MVGGSPSYLPAPSGRGPDSITHFTSEASGDRVIEAVRQWNQVAVAPYTLRSPEQIAAFFADLDLVAPGLVPCPRWRPDPGDTVTDMDEYCALGRTGGT